MAFTNGFAQSNSTNSRINWNCVSIAGETADAESEMNSNLTDEELTIIYNNAYRTCVLSASDTEITVAGPKPLQISEK